MDMLRQVQASIGEFVESACTALGEDLVSVVLFGSAAEGRLRELAAASSERKRQRT